MPKLFRRLVTHLSQNGAIKNFRAYLFQSEDNAIHIPLAEMATLRRYVETDKNRMRLRFPAEELVFIPD